MGGEIRDEEEIRDRTGREVRGVSLNEQNVKWKNECAIRDKKVSFERESLCRAKRVLVQAMSLNYGITKVDTCAGIACRVDRSGSFGDDVASACHSACLLILYVGKQHLKEISLRCTHSKVKGRLGSMGSYNSKKWVMPLMHQLATGIG